MTPRPLALVLAAALALTAPLARAATPVTTAFTYQGQVLKSGSPAVGTYNLQFKLYDALTAGAQVGVTQTVSNVAVAMGTFTVTLDFGAAFDGNARWLEIAVQGPGDATFTTLAPRQPLTAAPYALFALNGGGGGGLTLPYTGSSVTTGGSSFTVTNNSATGTSPALVARSASSGLYSPALQGEALSTTGSVIGVLGKAMGGSSGFGVEGDGSYVGVYGDGGTYGVSGNGGTYGTYGSSSFGKGVYGSSLWGIGTQGVSTHDTGVHGSSTEGWGVYGTTSGAGKAGVFGQTSVANTAGVLGRSESTNPSAQAVYGYASSAAVGVMGISEGNDGISGGTNAVNKSGVYGWASNAASFGGFFTNGAGGVALKADGLAQVRTLQILGGADLAERFDGDAAAEPGTVMAIDAAHEGRLAVCAEGYCPRVAGVVSGANDLSAGVTLGDHPDPARSVPLALSGRVWVKCDATAAPIRPGDLLTTAPRAGHAMRALDRERAAGAVLGKAMTSLEAGTGLVLVLVSLQ